MVRRRYLAYALFFLSGATALVYQVSWVRNLTLTFGASRAAVSIVLAAFMAGLALGGVSFGRWAKRSERPLRLYGLLEIGIGLTAALLPTLLAAVDRIYVSAALQVAGVPWTLHLLRVALAFSVLLLPTWLMGGTLPVLTRAMVRRGEEFGVRLSLLYGINTAGAVLGTLLAGFVLLRSLGVWHTQLVAIGVTLTVGAAAFLAGAKPIEAEEDAPEPLAAGTPAGGRRRAAGEEDPVDAHPALARAALRATFFGTAVCGMCALALEVLWTRGISVSAGTTTYSFTVMLAAFLIGIALGSGLHAAFPLRRLGVSLQFGLVVLGIGVTSAAVSQLIAQLPYLAYRLNAQHEDASLRAWTTLVLSFAIMLVPCVLMGAAFPLAGEGRARLRPDFGRSVGDVVGLNTLGAIAGAFAAGFVLIPWLGLQRGMLLASAVNAAYGLLVIGLALAARRGRTLWLAPAVAGSCAALAAAFLLPSWDARALAVFRNNVTRPEEGEDVEHALARMFAETEVLYYAEGRGANVSVIDFSGNRSILIDGKSVATDILFDMQHELLLGHLPVLLHPDPENAIVIGCGAAVTLGSVTAHPDLERVVLVEIEPAVIDGARQFAHVNDDPFSDPRLEIVFQDGRNYLLTSAELFDVVTADPIHPWASGSGYLYTVEYYRMIREHITPGGVMCQWLPLYELSIDDLRTVIAGFADAFEHTTVWQTTFDTILIGSDRPLGIDPARLAERLRAPSVRRQLAQIGLDDPLSLLAELTMDEEGVARFTRGAGRNTDDNLYLEFSAPFSIMTRDLPGNVRTFSSFRPSLAALGIDLAPVLPPGWPPDRPTDALLEAYRRAKADTIEGEMLLFQAFRGADPESCLPVIDGLERVRKNLPEYGRTKALLSLALTLYGKKLHAAGREEEAHAAVRRALQVRPHDSEANYRLGVWLSDRGDLEESLPYFEAALEARPRFALAHKDLGVTHMRMGRFAEAEPSLLRALEIRPRFPEASAGLGVARMETGRPREAEDAFRKALEQAPDLPGVHNNFGVLLAGERRFDEAVELLRRGRARHPGDSRLTRQLAWLLATAPDERVRDAREAVALAEALDGSGSAETADTQAAALASAGRYAEAADLAERAAALARESGRPELADEILRRRALYQSGRPFREEA